MNIVITTGCQNSGWKIVLPILQQSGLELAGADVNRLLDEYFQEAGAGDALQICQPLQPDSSLGGDVAALLPDTPSSTVLLADSRNIWLLDFWAQQFPQAQFLLFYTRAETALAYALQQGVEPLQFMEYWQAANRQLLQFHRRHRQRTLLFDAESSRLHPQALEAACQRIGLTLKPASNLSAPAITIPAVERLLAEYLLSAQPEIQMLQMELEASACPLGDTIQKKLLQPAELVADFRNSQVYQRDQQQELEQTHQALFKMESAHLAIAQENELLLQQLHQVQAELGSAFQQKLQAEHAQDLHFAELTELKIQLEQIRHISAGQKTSLRESTQVNELLLMQLRQVQEELAATLHLKQQVEQAQVQQACERQELNIRLEQAQQNLQKQEANHQETAQENELLQLQLQQIQVELEHYFLKCQELVAKQHRQLQAEDIEIYKPRRRKNISQLLTWNIAIPSIRRLFKNPDKEQRRMQQQVDVLKASGLFNETWYLSAYPDVRSSGIDPVKHYLFYGVAEGRNPSPEFDTQSYLAAYPDVAAAGMNPLIHFVKYGKAEGRLPYQRESA